MEEPADSLACIVLAAGKGTRMKSDLPKVLHEVNGKPILDWVLGALQHARITKGCVVIGGDVEVFASVVDRHPGLLWAEQVERRGTGDAVAAAACAFAEIKEPHFAQGKLLRGEGKLSARHVLICLGDVPAMRAETLSAFVEGFRSSGCQIGVLGMQHPEPTGYGRLVRDDNGRLLRIVEEKDANADEKSIGLCNSGMIIAETKYVFELIDRLKSDNAQGEYYLTDCFELAVADSQPAYVFATENYREFDGINDQQQLAQMESWLKENR